MLVPTLHTERLVLRAWRPEDRAPFAAMNAEPEVVRWIGDGAPLTRAASDALVDRIDEHWRARGFGLWENVRVACSRAAAPASAA